MKKIRILLILSSCLLISCQNNTVYTHFEQVSSTGWSADSVLTFDADIADSTGQYDVLFTVCHTREYPYQNLWLFVEEYVGNTLLLSDTIEAFLADNYGRWLGSGKTIIELPLLYEQAHVFGANGIYTYRIRQGMREESLQGITSLGVSIENCHGQK